MAWRLLACATPKSAKVAAKIAILALAFGSTPAMFTPAFAKPAFMDKYNRDPTSRPELHGKCTVCHIGRGGGERNDFGEAFGDAGFRINDKLRKKFPELFLPPSPPPQ